MRPEPDITVLEECAAWHRNIPQAARVCQRAARAAWFTAGGQDRNAAGAQHAANEVVIVLADDDRVRRLNSRYRGMGSPTNVLSFRYADSAETIPASELGEPQPLGDIVVAFETAQNEAASEGRSLADHLSRLVVHGMLHLLGFDHVCEEEAEEMEHLERSALTEAGVVDPEAPLVSLGGDATHGR